MGFHVEINSILRSDDYTDLKVGEVYSFEKSGSRVFFDNIPVWVTKSDWTAQAEISIVSQTKTPEKLTGQFRVDYIYEGEEQQAVTNLFIRMYGGISDPYIYLISSQQEYDDSMTSGVLMRDSLESEGFIHASPASQLDRVANKFYTEVIDPLIMIVDKAKIKPELKWEPATGGLYPHIYGPMNMDAVSRIQPISKAEDGKFRISINNP